MNRGLLTKRQREFLRGEVNDIEDEQQYIYNIRSDFRERMERLEEDLQLLRDAGQDELAEEFYVKFERVERLEREVEELRDELNE